MVTVLKTLTAAACGVCVALWITAASVKASTDEWAFIPYPWVWVVLGVFVLAGLAWLGLMVELLPPGIRAKKVQEARARAWDEGYERMREQRNITRLEQAARRIANGTAIPEPAAPPERWWTIGRGQGDIQLVTNTGSRTRYNVELTGTEGVHTDADSKADVLGIDDSVEFAVWQGGVKLPLRLTLRWTDTPGGEFNTATFSVRPTR